MGKKKKPFKVITDAPAFRDRLGEVTGNELKVWMYIWLHTNGELTAFPGNKTIAQELRISVDTVKEAKRGLRAKGWTSREKQRRRGDGTMSTVVEKTHLPWGKKASTDTVVEKTDGGKTHQQKEYSVIPEVSPSADSDKPLNLEEKKVSKQASEEMAPADQTEEKTTPDNLTAEEETLLNEIMPIRVFTFDHEHKSDLSIILAWAAKLGVDAVDVLRYNRSVKKGGLYIRTPRGFTNALIGDAEGNFALLNEYILWRDRAKAKAKSNGAAGGQNTKEENSGFVGGEKLVASGFDIEEA